MRPGAEIIYQLLDDLRTEILSTLIHFADSTDQSRRRRVLQHIAGGADIETLQQVLFVLVHGKEDKPRAGIVTFDDARGFKARHSWHPDVHQDHIGPEFTDFFESLDRIAGFARDLDVRLAVEQAAYTVAK